MTVHARRIASVPRRSAIDTWNAIVDLVTTSGSTARQELFGLRGLGAAVIAEEYTRDAPIIVSGVGPQVRIYTVHGDDAVESDLSDERPFNHQPTQGEWTVSIPCGSEDLDELVRLAAGAPHVLVRSFSDDLSRDIAVAAGDVRPVINLAALEES